MGSVLVAVFQRQGNGAGALLFASARWYIVKVSRTTANVCTASNSGVRGVWMKSPIALGDTGVSPVILIRPSRGPVETGRGRNALRMPISATLGSCFQRRTRGPFSSGSGIGGKGFGIGCGCGGVAGAVAARINLRRLRYSAVGVGT